MAVVQAFISFFSTSIFFFLNLQQCPNKLLCLSSLSTSAISKLLPKGAFTVQMQPCPPSAWECGLTVPVFVIASKRLGTRRKSSTCLQPLLPKLDSAPTFQSLQVSPLYLRPLLTPLLNLIVLSCRESFPN